MIVEFLEDRDFLTAWVLNPASHRLSVLASSGREMTVSLSRVLNSADLPDPGDKPGRLELLRATEAARAELSGQVDLGELWEVLEGEGQVFSYESLATLFFGRSVRADEISALTRAVFRDGLRFRFGPEGAIRHSAEELELILDKRRKAEEAERARAAMAEWVREAAAGRVAAEPPEGPKAVEILTAFALWEEKAPERQEARKILELAGLPATERGAFQALVAVGEFSLHENLELKRLDFPLNFQAPAFEAAATLAAQTPAWKSGRLDLSSLNTLTIDSNGARDLDDAVSIKSLAGGRWQVGIHITDVAAFIGEDSILDLEARGRASSLYLPEGKYPMLPAELSEGFFSLTPGDLKPALSILATLEKDGQVGEYSIDSSLIRVDRQLSFSEADQLLEEDSDLVDLWDLAQTLTARREAEGGVNLNIPKLNVYFQPDGSLGLGLTQWDTPAKTIIGELMILANYLAADYLHRNGYPCPYRFQEKARPLSPDEQAMADSGQLSPDQDLALNLAARRRTGRSGLSFVPAQHYGLGLPLYTAFTAPMRRYVDLLVARQLRSLIQGGPPAMDQQSFLRLALPAHELAQRLQKIQNSRQRYWLNQHLAGKIGQTFPALVFEQHERRLRVCVSDYMLEVEVQLPRGDGGRPPSLFGQRLMVKLASVSPGGDESPRFEVLQ